MAILLLPLQVPSHRADRLRGRVDPRRGRARSWHGDHLGRRHPDLGGEPDRRGARRGPAHLAPAGRHPYEILRFIGRGTSLRDYQRLKAALDRLQSTTICTSIRQPAEGRRHRFSWINEWKERTDRNGKPDGIELILPDWFYQAVLDDALVLTIDRAYFGLTGGLDRWLYRIRKHGGRQRNGWRFDFRHLHQKSGALSPSSASPSSCATSSGASRSPATRCSSRSKAATARCSPSSHSPSVEKLWMASCHREPEGACHQEPEPRANGNPNRP
jgi:hypothetical protein